jgi:hypothetical protein
MEFPWIELLKNVGPLAAIIIFFVWRDWQREILQAKRTEKLEEYQRETLRSLVEKSTMALTQSSECLKWIGHVIERLARICPRMVGQDCDPPTGLKG